MRQLWESHSFMSYKTFNANERSSCTKKILAGFEQRSHGVINLVHNFLKISIENRECMQPLIFYILVASLEFVVAYIRK